MQSSWLSIGTSRRGADDGHPWMSELRDLLFSAELVGSSVEVILDRFLRYEEEEKTR